MLSFESTQVLQPRFGKPCSWVRLVVGFYFLLSGVMRAPLRQGPRRGALRGRAGRLPLPAPALPGPRPPFAGNTPPPWARRWSRCSWPGATLGAGSSSSAPICARRCWRSPLMTRYRPAPRQPCWSRREGEGTGESPGRRVGTLGWKVQGIWRGTP